MYIFIRVRLSVVKYYLHLFPKLYNRFGCIVERDDQTMGKRVKVNK